MAKIKYIDETGEHTGTLTGAEYYIYSAKDPESVVLKPTDRVPYFSWQHTDYEPFKRAVENKYKTTVTKTWITK